jgi:hypothetical protein
LIGSGLSRIEPARDGARAIFLTGFSAALSTGFSGASTTAAAALADVEPLEDAFTEAFTGAPDAFAGAMLTGFAGAGTSPSVTAGADTIPA